MLSFWCEIKTEFVYVAVLKNMSEKEKNRILTKESIKIEHTFL